MIDDSGPIRPAPASRVPGDSNSRRSAGGDQPDRKRDFEARPRADWADDHRLTFLKLGGALLTHKDQPATRRPRVLERLVEEVASWPGTHQGFLVLAHGSGSFGHAAVLDSGFLERPRDPLRFARVASAARQLNQFVVEALLAHGVPAVAVPGSLLAVADGGRICAVRLPLVSELLERRLVPVVYGDVVVDRSCGGSVASTEALLLALARHLQPERIILATDVDGVFPRPPGMNEGDPTLRPISVIRPGDPCPITGPPATPDSKPQDVTGGMAAKVATMLDLVQELPGTEVRILSGLRRGAVRAALAGDPDVGGTLITAG